MSKNLENFVRDNRENFDTANPSPKVWENIESKLNGSKKETPVRQMKKKWWMAAAAITLILSATAAYFLLQQPPAPSSLAETKTTPAKSETRDLDIAAIDPNYAKQVAKFSGLIEEKQKELQLIQTEQPSLYEKFSDDIKKLDSTYHLLKHELPVNPNKEELLQAMIYNLQLQIDLLNQQLNIIQKIKASKSKSI